MGKCKVIAITNQKGSLTISLGVENPDDLDVSLATVMDAVIEDETITEEVCIIHHDEGVDLMPANIELSGMETGLFNIMSREYVLKNYIDKVRQNYDYVSIDCMTSLGMMIINALVATDSVIIPSQPSFLSAKGLNLLLHSISKVKRSINPKLSIDEILLIMVDKRTNNAKENRIPKIFENPLTEIDDFPNHPFKVRLDEDMDRLVESVKSRGVITPVTLRQKEDGGTVGHNFEGQKTRDIIAETSSDSARQIQRYICLTEFQPELLNLVDEGKIGLRPAVELSYLNDVEQQDLVEAIESIMTEENQIRRKNSLLKLNVSVNLFLSQFHTKKLKSMFVKRWNIIRGIWNDKRRETDNIVHYKGEVCSFLENGFLRSLMGN